MTDLAFFLQIEIFRGRMQLKLSLDVGSQGRFALFDKEILKTDEVSWLLLHHRIMPTLPYVLTHTLQSVATSAHPSNLN